MAQPITRCPDCNEPVTTGLDGKGKKLTLDAEPVMGWTLATDTNHELYMRFVPVWSVHVCLPRRPIGALVDGIHAGLEGTGALSNAA